MKKVSEEVGEGRVTVAGVEGDGMEWEGLGGYG